ncbi:2-keto-4-pentenoate hydratase [Mycolicibacterium hassiacum DSM 44199]|jgi:2-keto-4-pentenoate hydratase|uniref:2-keto-4-pentenoate hydratase n=1 Tax=Mycolicibacterium hassiacum (strain DSM 44199 / CIP 105218 / JCM 12690 / 3849) TaxID=1122247 RepID=K5BHL9_MYCHD|nr:MULTISPECIES: fumarylacetoacetate hydrolase family protein [Mycolicibacterium]PZN25560.1 MAG: 2-keto-4-pentenoate hydratase [Mycolicibacterium hassiacum]EID10497.1 2-hydroxypenta-2,4-dienoate hydratase [Mycolicibacterium phlei RIVM601174]EKF25792.1 2-keto-4-pentenoate hydratase [Mycolicibacterium hassiacum DSM 44199]MBF4194799.1 2-hydroxypenta-2,4-dienoate hydratase [Mycolicibacterium phlei]MDA4086735.1 2-keto-4-pentenoate hydratase [Mycolicibacterium hassiacum DSM 44199]
MTVTTTELRQAADRLLAAADTARQCEPVRDILGDSDIGAAYAVQALLTEAALARGRHIVGHKIGLTAPAVQRQLGVDQPDSGVLFADMRIPCGGTVTRAGLLQPKVEAEVAFILAEDLDGELSEARIRAAAGKAVAALEIVDSRVRDWSISIVDTIADNGSSARFVLGETAVAADQLDLTAVSMTLSEDGAAVSSGTGADCLGSPLNALWWLARTAQANGTPLRAGHIVLSGALGPMVPARFGSTYLAEIDGIGSVQVSFEGEQR